MNTIVSSPKEAKEGDILHMHLLLSLGPHPPLIQRGGGGDILHMNVHFPMGPRPSLAQKGEGGMCLKCPPPRFSPG